jgi:hypothetical protein
LQKKKKKNVSLFFIIYRDVSLSNLRRGGRINKLALHDEFGFNGGKDDPGPALDFKPQHCFSTDF